MLAAITATIVTVEVLLRAFVIPIANTSPHRAYLLYSARHLDVAIGDSHVYRSFLGSDRFVNLGRGGTTVGEMNALARAFYTRHDRGRAILQASPHLLSQPTSREGLDKQFAMMIHSPLLIAAFEPAIATHLGRAWDLGRLKKDRKRVEAQRSRKGAWHRVSRSKRHRSTKSRVEVHRPQWNSQARATIGVYDEMLSYLEGRGVTVCMLRPPVSREYLEMTKNDRDYLEAELALSDLALQHEVRLIDFRDLDLELSASMFLNTDHITPAASSVFVQSAEAACFEGGQNSHRRGP